MRKNFTGILLLIAVIFISSCDDETDVASGMDQVDVATKSTIIGTNGDDFLNGTSSSDYLEPRNGDDIVNPQGGNDEIYIEKHYADMDTVYLYGGNDSINIFISQNKPEQNAYIGKLVVYKFASTTGTKRINVFASRFAKITYAYYSTYTNFYVKTQIGNTVIYKIKVRGYTRDTDTHWVDVNLI